MTATYTESISVDNLTVGGLEKDGSRRGIRIPVAPKVGANFGIRPPRGDLWITGFAAVFNGDPDPTIMIGYNQRVDGSLVVAGEPGAGFAIEGNFNDGSGQNKMEAYVQFLTSDGLSSFRPFFAAFNRVTGVPSSVRVNGDLVQITNAAQTRNITDFFNDGINGVSLTMAAANYNAPTTISIRSFAGQEGVSGLYLDPIGGGAAVRTVSGRRTGWTAATNTKLRTTFDTTTVTLPNLAARVGALLDDLIAHGMIGA